MNLAMEEFVPKRRHRRDIKRHVTVFDPVYRIVDLDTGDIKDDNDAFGFTGEGGGKRALARWQAHVLTSKFVVEEWLKAHPEEGGLLFEIVFDLELGRFGNVDFVYTVLLDILDLHGLEPPVSVETLYRILVKLIIKGECDDMCLDSSLAHGYRFDRAVAIRDAF